MTSRTWRSIRNGGMLSLENLTTFRKVIQNTIYAKNWESKVSQFLQEEKPKQADFKANAPYFSASARADGIYKNHPYPFCLPREVADENLYYEIRHPIMAYFARNKIKWHDGQDGKPSNHLCSSQVCCSNFLFPFFDKPAALATLLLPIYPEIHEMLPIEDGQYVAFEWIGQQNYLGERMHENGKRMRGANYTSADAAVMFQVKGGQKQIVLIEWKYTESYTPTWLKYSASGTDRTKIYEHLYLAKDCPISKELLPDFDSLFYEPFYQFMREQFLAHEMEKAQELGADTVSLLHISPAHNGDFMRITSPDLRTMDSSATRVWGKLVKKTGRFVGEYTENIFGNFQVEQFPELKQWWQYINWRYDWVAG
jgi:hypothetical protein